jgi:hypothetical protein
MTRLILWLALFAAVLPAHAETLSLASSYKATGTNPDGSAYQGKVTVKLLSDSTFEIKWLIGGSTYDGFGMRRNDTLAATYMIDGEPGLVVYHVDGNGLDGLWAVRGRNGNGTEHLTPAE